MLQSVIGLFIQISLPLDKTIMHVTITNLISVNYYKTLTTWQ